MACTVVLHHSIGISFVGNHLTNVNLYSSIAFISADFASFKYLTHLVWKASGYFLIVLDVNISNILMQKIRSITAMLQYSCK